MKRMRKLLACLCMAALVALTAAGCGSDKPYKTVQEYLDDNSNDLSAFEKAFEGTGMKLSITAEGSKLVYTAQYEVQLPVDDSNKAEIEASLKESMEGQKSNMEETLEGLKELIDDKNVSIVFRYLNMDGTEIYSGEFK